MPDDLDCISCNSHQTWTCCERACAVASRTGRGRQPSGLTVRFFLVDEGPFFLARVTLIGSGVLARASSSGTSYCWNDGNVGGGVDMRSNKLGVCCRETGADA